MMENENELVKVSIGHLLLSTTPLLLVCFGSYMLNLGLVTQILVSCVRTFVQLTVVGLVLVSLFTWGEKDAWVVFGYVFLMIILAAWVSSSRPKYHFKGQFWCVLFALLINVTLVSLFAFVIIIQPTPLWNPQYVIPICGMLLGNCINGVSLALNSLTTSLVEQQSEIELLLCFGATKYEASSRVLREAIRSGSMPTLNGMAVIGLISIPGMMTGQILGGTTPQDAANYQMLIMYLIATCSFGVILCVMYMALAVGFDGEHRLLSYRFRTRDKNGSSLWSTLEEWCCFCCSKVSAKMQGYQPFEKSLSTVADPEGGDGISINRLNRSSLAGPVLSVTGVSRSVPIGSDSQERRTLFTDFNVILRKGEIATVTGPSGAGKSQFLRCVCGLVPVDSGDIKLNGKSTRLFRSMAEMRKRIRYVTQYKIDMPGTPKEFIRTITELGVNRKSVDSPRFNEMVKDTRNYIVQWGMDKTNMDKEWKSLSGGEAQRVILAISMASRPKVLLMDETTSALDFSTKTKVEKSIERFAKRFGIALLMITHDAEQISRLSNDLGNSSPSSAGI